MEVLSLLQTLSNVPLMASATTKRGYWAEASCMARRAGTLRELANAPSHTTAMTALSENVRCTRAVHAMVTRAGVEIGI